MLDAFKRLISGDPVGPDWRGISGWAKENGLGFKRAHEDQGFVIDGGKDGAKPWRLEWGPSQRAYIDGQELRLRVELGVSSSVQMLLLSQPLLETLERQAFERFTQSLQTVIDDTTPEEMRWLAMYPKVSYQAAKEVRARFGLVGSKPEDAASWVEGPLARQLERAAGNFLLHDPPFLLMVLRGRVYLRLALPEPEAQTVAQAVNLFETAILQVARVAASAAEDESKWPSKGPATAWQDQLGPAEPGPEE